MEQDIEILEELWLNVLLTNDFNKFICNNDKYRKAIKNTISRIKELEEERQIVGMPVRNKRDGRIGIVLHQ